METKAKALDSWNIWLQCDTKGSNMKLKSSRISGEFCSQFQDYVVDHDLAHFHLNPEYHRQMNWD